MFRLGQETIAIAIVTVGLALAGLDVTGGSIRSEMQAMRGEARADREAWQAEAPVRSAGRVMEGLERFCTELPDPRTSAQDGNGRTGS